MAHVEGTYTIVKGKESTDFYVAMGATQEEADSFVGSHWTMKVWKDGDSTWGGHITCKEHPMYNCLDSFTDGVEKCVNHPLYGGKGKLLVKKTSDGFSSIGQTEKFGKVSWDEKYTAEGAYFTITAGGKTIKEFWERCVKVDGAYVYEKSENLEAYFKAVGYCDASMMAALKYYKVNVCKKGDTIHIKERIGGKTICNSMTLDVEGPFNYPDDKEGETPKRRGLTTKAGVGKYLTLIKSPDGINEEWTMCFTDCGLCMTATEKKTGQTCKTYLKRFNDVSGTYKMTTAIGFEKFAEHMGLPCSTAQEMISDCSARMVICDMGNGCQRHQYTSKKFSNDLTFKLNEEFSFHHPILNECVKAVATQSDSTMCLIMKTSKGTVVCKTHFNCNFVVSSICMPSAHIGYKVVFERQCCH